MTQRVVAGTLHLELAHQPTKRDGHSRLRGRLSLVAVLTEYPPTPMGSLEQVGVVVQASAERGASDRSYYAPASRRWAPMSSVRRRSTSDSLNKLSSVALAISLWVANS